MYSTCPDYTPLVFMFVIGLNALDAVDDNYRYDVGTAFDLCRSTFTSYWVIGGDCVRKDMVVMNVMLKMRRMTRMDKRLMMMMMRKMDG